MYHASDYTFDFYIKPGCEIYVTKRKAVSAVVALDISLDDFNSSITVVTFELTIANALGIDADLVIIIAIRIGSVEVEY